MTDSRLFVHDVERNGTTRDVVLIVSMLAVISALHLFTAVRPETMPMHLLYRRLYYLPIMYAGLTFGRRGGLVSAFAASVVFVPYAALSLGGLTGLHVDNMYEVIMYLGAGIAFGWMHDREVMRTADLRQVSGRLEDAYRTLEERAIQLMNVEEYTQSILRSITSGVLTVGPDGSVATANPAAEHMLGLKEVEMVPRRVRTFVSNDGGLDDDIVRVLNGRLPRIVREVSLVVRDGRTLHVRVYISLMRDIDGRVLGGVVTIEDVSEVKALTDQLIRADRLAAMGELTAGVAHEVRNPLGIIRASVQLVEDVSCDRERLLAATKVVKQEIDRLDRVIKALLDFGRPSSPSFSPVGMNDVVEDVLLLIGRFASQAHVDIERRLESPLPQVRADADQLKQVLVNLISNAVQAMGEAGGSIVVSTSVRGDFIAVSVLDDGPGIPPELLSKVFDPFYSTKDDGTGLGLTMVHRIVDEHDGHIEVASKLNEGTRFTVSLPILRERES